LIIVAQHLLKFSWITKYVAAVELCSYRIWNIAYTLLTHLLQHRPSSQHGKRNERKSRETLGHRPIA